MKSNFSHMAIRMASAVLALVALAAISQFIVEPAKAQSGNAKHFTIDVAEDCTTAYINPVDPNENTLVDEAPGDTVLVSGAIYPGGTLKPGAQSNLPTDPGSIGRWMARAVFLVNTTQFNHSVSPIGFATMLYQFPNSSSSLMSEGLVPNIGASEMRAVTGGTGPFSGAVGEVRHDNIGINGTGCFNYRFTFKLKD